MKTRIISALIMTPLFLVVYFGGPLLAAGCFLIGIMGTWEFFHGFSAIGVKPCYPIAAAATAALYALNFFGIRYFADLTVYYELWFFAVIVASLLTLFRFEQRQLIDAMATITGVFYVSFFSYHIVLVEQTGRYGLLVWLIFLSAFGTDILAYFTGYFLGKHKLCPVISPKKTIEGSVGGMAGSIALCALFGYFCCPELLVHCVVLGAAGGVISQFGDLTASIFKRKMGIKDYSHLIPGHGGILDRFDSVLFTAPMVYYYIELVLI